jgi:hypothetical protein
VHSSLDLGISCLVSGVLPRGGESLAQVSGSGGPAMEFSVVAWARSHGPLLGFAMAQPLNKLGASQTLDPDLGFPAGLIGRSAMGFPGMSFHFHSRRGGEEITLLMLWFAWPLVLQQGAEKQLPGVYSHRLFDSRCTRRPTGGHSHPIRRRRSVSADSSRTSSTSEPRCRFGGPFPPT